MRSVATWRGSNKICKLDRYIWWSCVFWDGEIYRCRATFCTLVPSWHTRAYGDVQGQSGGINIELRLCSIRLILNGALWAFRGIDRPQSGNHIESETRSRDFPWVPSIDPAAATWMVHVRGSYRAYFDTIERYDRLANIFSKLYIAILRLNTVQEAKTCDNCKTRISLLQ